MTEALTTKQDYEDYIVARRNWGRWGADDELGTINLITPQKRVQAASLIRSGRTVSMSRPLPTIPKKFEQPPTQHFMKRIDKDVGGLALDYIGVTCHGHDCTHIDALCHMWNDDGMYNGRDPNEEITFNGARFGSVERWSDGIVTRCVLFDVPRFRGTSYVTTDEPVLGSELEAIAAANGLRVEPGDAVAVYCGREIFEREHPGYQDAEPRAVPGLHGSCLHFLRETDTAVLLWDMMDCVPNRGIPGVHSTIANFGLALVDNALLEPIAALCADEGRYEFNVTIAPLHLRGGTGSPVNPIAQL